MINSPGVNEFIDLKDTPNSYAGKATNVPKVNAGETALEFEPGGGGAVISVNGQTGVVVLTTSDISITPNFNYVSDAQLIVLGNTSGVNSGDNATNSQYSGLAASKQDVLVSGTNIKTVNGSTLLGSGDLVVTGVTNLSYTAATRIIASDTGSDATLPLFTSSDAGLTPASGGGTSNFLRADGTWSTPAGGSGLTALQVFSAVSIRM